MSNSDIIVPPYRLRSTRLSIRCWRPEDAPLLKDALDSSLEHLRPWMPWAHNEPSEIPAIEERLTMFREKFLTGSDWIYAIFDGNEERVIGGTGLHPRIGPGALEIGYWIRADAIGKGYATEAAAALTRVAFERCAVERMEIRCDPRNEASAAIPPKLGYRFERTLVGNLPDHDNIPRDTMVWTMPRASYAASPAAAATVEGFDVDGARVM